MRLTCAVCGEWFGAPRSDTVTCSAACRQKRHRKLRAETPPLPGGTFDLLHVDLPLRWDAFSAKGEGRSPQRHYRSTMDVAALCRLPIADILAKDAVACFWVYGPRLPDTLRVIGSWGLTFKAELFCWTKINRKTGRPHIGTGKTTRKTTENAWLATRGKGLPILDHGVSQSIWAPRRAHSEKPDEAYQSLKRLFGDNVRRLDLFARRARPGWTIWGNEISD
jgi:N6-adenosine-specific RNA methylase IME4